MSSKKGQLSIYFTLIIISIIVVMIAAFAAPMGVRFNTEMYLAGQGILEDANSSIQSISNTEIRTQVQDSVNNALAASANNIEVNANLFQYSWILVIGLSAIVVFLYTRRIVEFGGGGYI